jgi:short-subunit dehydrogenase
LITGATNGIGKSFCHALAKRGFNIILVARDPKKLAKVAAQVCDEHDVRTLTITADFA